MQVPFKVRFQFADLSRSGFDLHNKGECHIENVGIMHLCKSKLDNLEEISLSKICVK